MGRSLTSRGLVDPVDPAGLDPAVLDPVGPEDLAVLDPVGPGDLVDLGLAGRADLGLADPHPADPAVPAHIRDPAGLDPAARVELDQADLAVLHPVDLAVLHPVDLAVPGGIRGRVDPVGRAGLDLAGREDLVDQGMNRVDRADPVGLDLTGRVDLVDQGMNLVDRAGLVDRADLVGLVDRAGRVIRADRHRRRTRPEVLSTAVAPRWAARGMCRTASAHPGMVRRLRPHNADGVGMAGLHPERRRLGGMDRRPRVAGTVHHLPVVGTPRGTGRRAT
jgi:hypothetical protein